jgi:hypothetical protein
MDLPSAKDKGILDENELKNSYDTLKALLEKKLLIKSDDPGRKDSSYKISEIGIFYLLLIQQTFGIQTQKKLLLNYYNDSVIIKLFVYPYISYESIKEIDDSGVFSHIFIYLGKCCEKVKDTLYYIDSTSNSYEGYLTNQVFIWNKTSIDNPSYHGLRSFLKYYFNLNWIDIAEIKKDSHDK